MATRLSRPVRRTGELGEPAWQPARHLILLSSLLVEVAMRRLPRLAIFMPPRHGKSELTSHWFPVWLLELWPDLRLILASYEAEFAATWGRKVRDSIVRAPLGELRVQVDERRSSAADRWDTTAGGGMVTAGVRGPITGRGADVLIIDDPVKNQDEARSKLMRERTWDWWQGVARTRLEPSGSVVLMMTRWHEDDLGGRLIAESAAGGERWAVLSLPALAEPTPAAPDALGRAAGEALWPERFDAQALDATRTAVGRYVWDSQFQQRPRPLEGQGLFREEHIRRAVAECPPLAELERRGLARVIVAVDPPGSTAECGIVVCGLLRRRSSGEPPRAVVLDDRSLAGPPELWGAAAVDAAIEWNADAIVGETNHGGDMVRAVIRAVERGRRVRFQAVHASRGKLTRAEPIAAHYATGQVWQLRRFPELEEQMTTWLPEHGMESPDRMDALVWGLTQLLEAPVAGRMVAYA